MIDEAIRVHGIACFNKLDYVIFANKNIEKNFVFQQLVDEVAVFARKSFS